MVFLIVVVLKMFCHHVWQSGQLISSCLLTNQVGRVSHMAYGVTETSYLCATCHNFSMHAQHALLLLVEAFLPHMFVINLRTYEILFSNSVLLLRFF